MYKKGDRVYLTKPVLNLQPGAYTISAVAFGIDDYPYRIDGTWVPEAVLRPEDMEHSVQQSFRPGTTATIIPGGTLFDNGSALLFVPDPITLDN